VSYEISNSDFTVQRVEVMELQPQQGSFYSSWLVTEDGKVITAKFDVESKHSLVESSGLNVVGIVKGRVK
jgi:hypothetical protein